MLSPLKILTTNQSHTLRLNEAPQLRLYDTKMPTWHH